MDSIFSDQARMEMQGGDVKITRNGASHRVLAYLDAGGPGRRHLIIPETADVRVGDMVEAMPGSRLINLLHRTTQYWVHSVRHLSPDGYWGASYKVWIRKMPVR